MTAMTVIISMLTQIRHTFHDDPTVAHNHNYIKNHEKNIYTFIDYCFRI